MYRRVLELDPANKDVQKDVGFMYMFRENYRETIRHLEPLAAADLSDGEVVGALGVSYASISRQSTCRPISP